MQQHQREVQCSNIKGKCSAATSKGSAVQQHQREVQAATSKGSPVQQHQREVQAATSKGSAVQQHQREVQCSNIKGKCRQQHQREVQCSNIKGKCSAATSKGSAGSNIKGKCSAATSKGSAVQQHQSTFNSAGLHWVMNHYYCRKVMRVTVVNKYNSNNIQFMATLLPTLFVCHILCDRMTHPQISI